jgi:UDP-N-acetyl-D-glucosamine dehydrogenase
VLVIGVAYKANIDDLRESPALDIIRLLAAQGAHVEYHDPWVPRFTEDGVERVSQPLTAELLSGMDCVMIVTDHKGVDWGLIKANATTVVDTRNAIQRKA